MKLSTKAIHIGQEPDELTGAVTVPLYQTSTYAQEAIGKHKGWEYARTQNPTRSRWEDCIAAMEGGMAAYAFGSGLAAIDTIMRTLTNGDHIVMAEDMYGGTYRLAESVLAKEGLSFSYVDMRDLDNVRKCSHTGDEDDLHRDPDKSDDDHHGSPRYGRDREGSWCSPRG